MPRKLAIIVEIPDELFSDENFLRTAPPTSRNLLLDLYRDRDGGIAVERSVMAGRWWISTQVYGVSGILELGKPVKVIDLNKPPLRYKQ